MKISSTRVRHLRLPADEPLAGGPPLLGPLRDFITVSLRTDQGIEGIGYTFFGGNLSASLKAAVQTFADLTVGLDPLPIEAVMGRLNASTLAGPGGVVTLALAAIDIALWDIKGKALGVPVATLAGGARERVPVYASGALARDASLDQLLKCAQTLRERGWKQMKTQLALPGTTTMAKEVERIAKLREVIGYDVDLMCDINQRWDVRQAISIGKQVEEYRMYWLEDVVACDDFAGHAAVTAALNTPTAAGEYVWGIVPFRHMFEARSVDIAMLDVMRTGGISGWLKIAAMAEAFNLPVVSHLYPEISVHLVAGVPNGLTVEYMPWTNRLFKETPALTDGKIEVPARPGLG
ncbi:MAG: mandelate racemase/muconate lactonizing enzyme family protein, partial [Betaproteobacteria bacterium]|nr:mandelate racemase/muconate lactonizing enzyme family protein [Betaproteobacteria bacterium]